MRSKHYSVISAASASLAFAFATSLSGAASAHAVLSAPTPRDTTAHKNTTLASQCGVARTGKFVPLTAGQPLTVMFNETVGHRGCFQVSFSQSGDANFQLLGQKDDPADGTGGRSMTVTIPNVNCTDCTLQLLQLMNDANGGTPCPANADWTKATSGTYHSCADVHVTGATGGGTDAGTTSGADSGTSTPTDDDGGTTPAGDDDDGGAGTGTGTGTGTGGQGETPQSGDTPNLRAGEGDDGCSLSSSSSSNAPSVFSFGLILFAAAGVVRRARKKSRA